MWIERVYERLRRDLGLCDAVPPTYESRAGPRRADPAEKFATEKRAEDTRFELVRV
jgi:hypothetical protein